MQCTCSTTILNKKRYFNPYVDMTHLQVPKGTCEFCRKQKQDDWCVRSYFEYDYCQRHNGFTLMILLTYNEKCVPRFSTHSEYDNDDYCFNAYDVRTFTESMKKHYNRRGEYFKYMLCSEYGSDDRFSQRPHLHGVFHFITSKSPADVLKHIRSLWHYGMVSPYKIADNLIIQSYKGIVYTSKYVTKDLDFYNRDSVKYLMTDPELLNACKHCLPQRYTSYQYGKVIEDIINHAEVPFQKLADGIRFTFNDIVYKVPRYIFNRLCYKHILDGETENGNPRYRRLYTDFGKAFFKFRAPIIVDRLAKQYDTFLSSQYVDTYLPDICERLGYDIKDFRDILSMHIDTKKLAMYKLFLCGRMLPKCTMELQDLNAVLSNGDINLFVNHYFDCLTNDVPAYELHSFSDPYNGMLVKYYNDLSVFDGYDLLLSTLILLKYNNAIDADYIQKTNNMLLKRLREYLYYVSSK